MIDLAGDNEDLHMEFMVYLEIIMKCFGYRVEQGVHSGNSEIGMESTYSVT